MAALYLYVELFIVTSDGSSDFLHLERSYRVGERNKFSRHLGDWCASADSAPGEFSQHLKMGAQTAASKWNAMSSLA